jgi:uncharacterized protein with NRDE domain
MSNASLDTPWPKMQRGKSKFKEITSDQSLSEGQLIEALFSMLSDPTLANPDELPQTGVPELWELHLSSVSYLSDLQLDQEVL